MPKLFERLCDHCGRNYRGWGRKYCSVECQGKAITKRAAYHQPSSTKARLTEVPQPVELNVTVPPQRPPKEGAFESVHYSDIHFPYQDNRALNVLLQVMEDVRPQFVCDHGDTLDCEEIGRFAKDPCTRVSVSEEIQMAAGFCGVVHALTPDAQHVWIEGNHEDRLRKLIWKLADTREAGEVLTLPEVQQALQWGRLLGVEELGWETIPYKEHFMLRDRLILKHGHSIRKWAGYTARAEHETYGCSGMSGHTHRQAAYFQRNAWGVHGWWELGMLGTIRNDYVTWPNWQQGFAVATWSGEEYGVELVQVNEGVAFFRGRRYEGGPESPLG